MLVTDEHSEYWERSVAQHQYDGDSESPGLYARPASGDDRRERERERVEQSVRRLTPVECERLQGFPDGWTDIGEWTDSKGKKHKEADSPRYKAIGNSIALPFWEWMAKRIVNQYDRPVTMGSLFSGIGGFELSFTKAGAEPIWESEVEPFCVAVLKKHFGDSETGEKGDYENFLQMGKVANIPEQL